MIRKKWTKLLTQCIVGFWVISACKPAVLQTITAPTPSPRSSPIGGQKSTPTGQSTGETSTQLSLTQVDNGKTLQLPLGQRFALQLGNAANWEITLSDPNIVSRVIGSPTTQGVQGIYEAKNPGLTTLTAASSQGGEGFHVVIEVPAGKSLDATPEQEASRRLYFRVVRMFTPLEGWALGSNQAPVGDLVEGPQPQGIFRTTDGGQSWLDVTPPSLIQAPAVSAYFADLEHAWLVNAGMRDADGKPGSIVVYSTEDGGQTWHASQPVHRAAGDDSSDGDVGMPGSLTFVDDQNGWLLTSPSQEAGSESVNIFRTLDGGQTWALTAANGDSSSNLPGGCIITGLTFRDNQTGWITGSCASGRLFFYVTQNGGQTWAPDSLLTPVNYPPDLFSQCRCSALPPQFPGGQFGVLPVSISENDPAAFLYRSQDGGQSWIPYTLPVSSLALSPVFADAQHGWISDGKALYISQDGGQSWTWISKLPTDVVLGGLNFMTPQTGFITDGLQLYASQDGGVTWTSWQPVLSLPNG